MTIYFPREVEHVRVTAQMQALADNSTKIQSEEKNIDYQPGSNVWVFNKDVQINGNSGGVIPEESRSTSSTRA